MRVLSAEGGPFTKMKPPKKRIERMTLSRALCLSRPAKLGEAENGLLAAGFPHVYIFRPAYIYPVTRRRELNFGYRPLRTIYPAFRVLFPNQVIRADDLARATVDVVVQGQGEHRPVVFENRDIQAVVE
jgi:hypothetical protein